MKFSSSRNAARNTPAHDPPLDLSRDCPLSDLRPGEAATILENPWQSAHADLLSSYGFFPGTPVHRVGSAPEGDPLLFRLEGRLVAVRRETAAQILVSRRVQ